MFTNHVVMEKLGVSWTLARCFLVVAVALFGVSAVLFAILFKHTKAGVRRLSKDEATLVTVYGRGAEVGLDPNPAALAGYGMVGGAAELKMDIDGLRNAARRRDWTTFWFWPIMLTTFVSSIWSALAAGLVAAGQGRGFLMVLLSAFVGLFLLIVWFMPWAAIYTNIDAGTAGTAGGPPVQTRPGQPRPPER